MINDEIVISFIEELRWQSRLASIAYREMLEHYFVYPRPEGFEHLNWESPPVQEWYWTAHLTFVLLNAFVTHVASVSRILWPGKPRFPLNHQEVRRRAARLRQELELPARMGISRRGLRDNLAHFDERLHVQHLTAEPLYRPSQDLDIDSHHAILTFFGQTFDLEAMQREIDTIYESCERWLRARGHVRGPST